MKPVSPEKSLQERAFSVFKRSWDSEFDCYFMLDEINGLHLLLYGYDFYDNSTRYCGQKASSSLPQRRSEVGFGVSQANGSVERRGGSPDECRDAEGEGSKSGANQAWMEKAREAHQVRVKVKIEEREVHQEKIKVEIEMQRGADQAMTKTNANGNANVESGVT
ncbi:hypothetical protein CMV_002307 [Castanea mollissima]|uniref:Uncharacterized protein n=1 Tax=Castanea mollissima TaxID=60419 RepID=A0A8J4W3S3_9ROSI|nr:hypothetical protein CMV_002307 [Castanea mollissima]